MFTIGIIGMSIISILLVGDYISEGLTLFVLFFIFTDPLLFLPLLPFVLLLVMVFLWNQQNFLVRNLGNKLIKICSFLSIQIWPNQTMIPDSLPVTADPGGADGTPAGQHQQATYPGVHGGPLVESLGIAELAKLLRSHLSDISHCSYNPSGNDGAENSSKTCETIGRALHTCGVGVG